MPTTKLLIGTLQLLFLRARDYGFIFSHKQQAKRSRTTIARNCRRSFLQIDTFERTILLFLKNRKELSLTEYMDAQENGRENLGTELPVAVYRLLEYCRRSFLQIDTFERTILLYQVLNVLKPFLIYSGIGNPAISPAVWDWRYCAPPGWLKIMWQRRRS